MGAILLHDNENLSTNRITVNMIGVKAVPVTCEHNSRMRPEVGLNRQN